MKALAIVVLCVVGLSCPHGSQGSYAGHHWTAPILDLPSLSPPPPRATHLPLSLDPPSTLATITQRLYDYFLENGDCTQYSPDFCATGGCQSLCTGAQHDSDTLLPNATWSDIDYSDQDRSVWLTAEHMRRVTAMARAYQCTGCTLRHNATVLANIHAALHWWLRTDPHNPNWWWNDFGIPQYVEIATFMINDTLSDPDYSKCMEILARANGSYTGENLVWSLQVLIGRAALMGDMAHLQLGFELFWDALFVSIPPQVIDGIQVRGVLWWVTLGIYTNIHTYWMYLHHTYLHTSYMHMYIHISHSHSLTHTHPYMQTYIHTHIPFSLTHALPSGGRKLLSAWPAVAERDLWR